MSEYLVGRGFPAPRSVLELGGGISNTVLLVESDAGRMVWKQALGKLRVEQDWYSDPARIFRESGGLRLLAPHLPPDSLPEVLFEDRENFAFAMSAAPVEAETWKAQLMRGDVDCGIARSIGEMLAGMIGATWRSDDWEARFGDQTVFDQLRLDAYYRATALRHPDLAPSIVRLMEESAARRVSIVHGDWSPKNFLVSGGSLMAIDFEVIHFGDPAFDTAFLLNHLTLKSFARPQDRAHYRAAAQAFWDATRAGVPGNAGWLEPATLAHLGALMLARVDGKSPAEYLDADLRARVRETARGLIARPPASVDEVFERI
jgi:aminoglycoside phosphotransferase (APT) family kinase protein